MSETTMPAAEATPVEFDERNSYEFAFHVLPTVAEGEVSRVFEEVKAQLINDGAEITVSESPERFELAYDIVKYLEGRNRTFKSAYFGWIRFKADSSMVEPFLEEIGGHQELLRHILIKLSKAEEAAPFYFHEALAGDKVVSIDVDEALSNESEAVAPEAEEEKVEEATETASDDTAKA